MNEVRLRISGRTLQFYFTDEIPDDIKEVTLSYTLYEMEKEDGS